MSPYLFICVAMTLAISASAEPEPTFFAKPAIKIIHHHPVHVPHFIHSRHLHVEPLILDHPPHLHHHHHHDEEIILDDHHHHDLHHHEHIHDHPWRR